MTEIITFAEHRSPAASSAWSTFLNCRLAYIEHQSEVTRTAVQAAYRSFAMSMGLTKDEARTAADRLDAVNGWEQAPSILIGSVH